MAEGRQRSEWNQTACILAMLHNTNKGRGGRVKQPSEFDPFAIKRQEAVSARGFAKLLLGSVRKRRRKPC